MSGVYEILSRKGGRHLKTECRHFDELPAMLTAAELAGALGVSVTELLTGDSGQWYRDAGASVSDCKTPEKFTQILLT